jgi:hypothetical protein
MHRIEGNLHLADPIYCSPDALETEYAVRVGGLAGTLATPRLPKECASPDPPPFLKLVPPATASSATPDQQGILVGEYEEASWGEPREFPSGNSLVRVVRVWFPIADDKPVDEIAPEMAEAIRVDLGPWLVRFTNALQVLSHQVIVGRRGIYVDEPEIELFRVDEKSASVREERPKVVRAAMLMPDSKHLITVNILAEAARYSSDGTLPRSEHALLAEARHARSDGDLRRAVIDAGTAVEVSASRAVADILYRLHGPEAGKLILGRFQGLWGRIKLSQVLGLPLPDRRYQKELVEVRNRAVHEGRLPSHEETTTVFESATAYILAVSPNRFEI